MVEKSQFETQKARAVAIAVGVQKDLGSQSSEVREAAKLGAVLQSWPVAAGEPDVQQFRSGVVRFAARWYLTGDAQQIAVLRKGNEALNAIQAAIQSKCNAEGIDVAFTSTGPRIRVPAPELNDAVIA